MANNKEDAYIDNEEPYMVTCKCSHITTTPRRKDKQKNIKPSKDLDFIVSAPMISANNSKGDK
jgi:hypothetical protein